MDTLVPLKVITTCNTSDTEILDHLRASQARPGPVLSQVATYSQPKPLVLVGSGPSAMKYLAQVPGEFDIMSMNGSYRALLAAGYKPKYYVQLDAREHNTLFVQNTENVGTKFWLASQCHPAMWDVLKGQDVSTFHLNVETTREVFPDDSLYLGGSGGTVGMTALALAGALGYRHLILVGYDSSLDNTGASHILYQPQNENQQVMMVYLEDRLYYTTPTMAEQVQEYFPWNAALHNAFPGLVIDVFGEGLFYDWIVTNALNPERTRELEAAKYTEMYQQPDYHMPAYSRALMRDLLDANRGVTLLDVGTGRGETLREAIDCGYTEVTGTETVDYLLQPGIVKALLPNLPFPDKSFDTVTCFEVLEHLLAEDVNPAIAELARVSKGRMIVSVCCRDAYHGGVNLHPSARPLAAWEQTLRDATPPGAVLERVGDFSMFPDVSPVYKITWPV